MKHLHYILLSALLILASCSKAPKPTSFRVSVSDVLSTKASIAVDPSDPDVYYTLGLINSNDKDYGKSPEELVRLQLAYMEELMIIMGDEYSFEDLFCYRGAFREHYYTLVADCDYKLLVFQVDPVARQAVGSPSVTTFRTKPPVESAMTFSFSFEPDKIIITPSTNERYFWEYENSDIISREYVSPQIFYMEMIEMYESYGFIDSQTDRGVYEWIFSVEDPNIQEGQKYTLVIAGYEDGETTSIGLKPDVESLISNVASLVDGYNRFITNAMSATEKYGHSNKFRNEMTGIQNVYRNELDAIGLSFNDDGTISIDEKYLRAAAVERDHEETLKPITSFTNEMLLEAKKISLNPMNYTNRVVVEYKNPGHNFANPYITSLYSGMMFSSYM